MTSYNNISENCTEFSNERFLRMVMDEIDGPCGNAVAFLDCDEQWIEPFITEDGMDDNAIRDYVLGLLPELADEGVVARVGDQQYAEGRFCNARFDYTYYQLESGIIVAILS